MTAMALYPYRCVICILITDKKLITDNVIEWGVVYWDDMRQRSMKYKTENNDNRRNTRNTDHNS